MLHYGRKIFILILIFFHGKSIAQQKDEIFGYSLEQGLPTRQVSDITIDKQGFLWLCTPNGISRFDGYEFLNFNSDNTKGLIDQNILSIAITDTILWFGTLSSLYTFNLNTYTVNTIEEHIEGVFKLFSDQKKRLWLEDSEGNISLITNQKVERIQDHYNKSWTNSTINLVTSFGEDDQGVWWGRLDGSIYRRDYETGKIVQIVHSDLLKKRGTPILFTDSSAVIFSVEAAWISSTIDSNVKTSYILSDHLKGRGKLTHKIHDDLFIHIDGENNAFEIHPSSNKVIHNQYLTEILSNSAGINNILIKENTWWIATNTGLVKFNRSPQFFQKILDEKSASVRSIYQYQNDKWLVSTYQGLYYLNNLYEIEYFNNYPYKVFQSYFKDKEGSLIGLEEDRGLIKIDSTFTKFENLTSSDDDLKFLSAIVHDDIAYMGCLNGLYQFDFNSGRTTLVSDPDTNSFIENLEVSDLLKDNEDLWVGTDNGLFKFNLNTKSIETVSSTENIRIRDLFKTNDEILWIGTKENGLISYHPNTNEINRYHYEHGLSNNTINSIIASDSDNYLWLGTNNGLSVFDRTNNSFINYYKDDGISHNEFNRKAILINNDGNIWMGGLDGITAFDPNEILTQKKTTPNILLTGVGKFDGKEERVVFNSGKIVHQREFKYHSNDRLFRFSFAINDFKYPELNKFRYKIEGLHQSWVDLSNQHELLIDNLSHGEHILSIAGTNGSGNWSTPLQLNLFVNTPFYLRSWFYVLIIFSLILTGYIIHRIRVAQLLKIERVRANIARDLHDELGSSLTRISMYSELAKETSGKDNVLTDVAQMSRDASSTLSDIVWSIDNTDDTIGSLVDRIKDHLFEMVAINDMEPGFKTEGLNEEQILKPELKQNIFLICKEAINNSVKHSKGTSLSIEIAYKEQLLKIEIIDNGSDNEKATSNKGGNGLRNMERRAKQIGGQLFIDKSFGFKISLSFPL